MSFITLIALNAQAQSQSRLNWVNMKEQYATSASATGIFEQFKKFIENSSPIIVLNGSSESSDKLLKAFKDSSKDVQFVEVNGYPEDSLAEIFGTAGNVDTTKTLNVVIVRVPEDYDFVSLSGLRSKAENWTTENKQLRAKVIVVADRPVRVMADEFYAGKFKLLSTQSGCDSFLNAHYPQMPRPSW